jgi:mono/diheme cytochrome c family protein
MTRCRAALAGLFLLLPGLLPAPAAPKPAAGLSDAQRKDFYHLPEGSELFPADWLGALTSVKTGKPFLDGLERFGLIPDPDGPEVLSGKDKVKLSVGLTLAKPRGSSLVMVGVNCAACHVGQVTYKKNKPIRIDGGPALFDVEGFYQEAFTSVAATLRDPRELLAFLGRLNQNPRKSDFSDLLKHLLAALKDPARKKDHLADLLVERLRTLAGVGADPAAGAKGSGHLRLAAAPAGPKAGELAKALLKAQEQAAADRLARLAALRKHAQARPEDAEGDLGKALARLGPTGLALLEARFVFLRRLRGQHAPDQPQYPPGPGRIDAFVTARNLLFADKDAIPASSPVRFPRIWDLAKLRWLHWDGNTNSVMERNIGQALGLGALATADGTSTVLPRNLHRLELLARKLAAPAWPAKTFGAIDRKRAARGAKLYKKYCASCHDSRQGEDPKFKGFGVYPLTVIDTDPERATNFAKTLSDGTEFAEALGKTLKKIKKKAFADAKIPAEEQKDYDKDDKDIRWATTKGYVARPLQGAWATAPYLHNGSVPTLADLLLPQDSRPVVFPVGHREYDPARVGYVSEFRAIPAEQRPRAWVYDTRLKGNSNRGHSGKRFGTELDDSRRRDLLEYLKVVGE